MFFSFVIDAYSRRVVGWQFATHMRTDLVLDALRMALTRRQHGADVELIHHSDAGSQYTSFAFQQELDDHGVLASIGSVGDAYDNAMAESFVDTFKTELIADRVWRTRTQLELAIVEWVAWFNNERLHESLGDIPPSRVRAPIRSTVPADHSLSMKRGNQQTRSPRNPARLTERTLAIELDQETRTVRRTTSLPARVLKGARPYGASRDPDPTELSASPDQAKQ